MNGSRHPTSRRPRLPPRALGALLAVALAAAAVVIVIVASGSGSGSSPGSGTGTGTPTRRVATLPGSVVGYEFQRQTIYHSPQTPGYTAWVGAWVMPDHSLMTAFVQATGPVDPRQRAALPEQTLQRDFGLTEQTRHSPTLTRLDPRFDFWGLTQAVIYLRSTDNGASWQTWRTDPFQALRPQAYTAQADIALGDGTLIRRVSGEDLANDPTIPHSALLETLHFNPADSTAQQAAWSAPQTVLHDPTICTYQISRIHQLKDGRVIALGSVVRYQTGTSGPCATTGYSFLLLVAAGATAAEHNQWTLGMPYNTQISPNEWDTAELPNGNLLALMRTQINGRPARRQAILQATPTGWTMQTPQPVPPIPALAPSGHPDLLTTTQGAILSLATTGSAYTTNHGTTWHTLTFPHNATYKTHYYPYAIQAPNNTIHIFSSKGYDSPYGTTDQSITMDTFKLRAATVNAVKSPG